MSLAAFNAAVEAGDRDAVAAMLDQRADLVHHPAPYETPWGTQQWLPLHRAARGGDVAMTRLLLDRGANLDARTRFHDPLLARAAALHLAAAGTRPGHAQVVKLLLSRGAFVDPIDAHHLTPLHLAIENGSNDAAMILIDAGANVNHVCPDDPAGFTPLHRCVSRGADRLPVARALLRAGADEHAFDPQRGWTPRQWATAAVESGDEASRAYLELLHDAV